MALGPVPPFIRLLGLPALLSMLLRFPLLLLAAAGVVLRELVRPNSFLRPLLLALLGKARSRRYASAQDQGPKRTKVNATYKVEDEKPI